MANRAQRRAMMRSQTEKNKALVASYRKEERIAGLLRNGITPEDLRREFETGRRIGFEEAGVPIVKSCYAGICLALQEEFGFGQDECFRAVKAVDEKVTWALGHQELVAEVLEKTGIELRLDEALERVEKKEHEEQELPDYPGASVQEGAAGVQGEGRARPAAADLPVEEGV